MDGTPAIPHQRNHPESGDTAIAAAAEPGVEAAPAAEPGTRATTATGTPPTPSAAAASAAGGNRFSVLGPIRAWRGGEALSSGTPQQRALLAVLLLRDGRTVTAPELIDAIWGEDPPQQALATIRTYASRLRKILEPGLLVSESGGYAIRLPHPEALDLGIARALAADAEAARAGSTAAGTSATTGTGTSAGKSDATPPARATARSPVPCWPAPWTYGTANRWPAYPGRTPTPNAPGSPSGASSCWRAASTWTWSSATTPRPSPNSPRSPPPTRCGSGCASC